MTEAFYRTFCRTSILNPRPVTQSAVRPIIRKALSACSQASALEGLRNGPATNSVEEASSSGLSERPWFTGRGCLGIKGVEKASVCSI